MSYNLNTLMTWSWGIRNPELGSSILLIIVDIDIMDSNYQMSAASNQEGGDGSDMDEPMASQGQVRIS